MPRSWRTSSRNDSEHNLTLRIDEKDRVLKQDERRWRQPMRQVRHCKGDHEAGLCRRFLDCQKHIARVCEFPRAFIHNGGAGLMPEKASKLQGTSLFRPVLILIIRECF
jgi:hypothetical protein